eukprot:4563658-Prymnesium_polylepis.1
MCVVALVAVLARAAQERLANLLRALHTGTLGRVPVNAVAPRAASTVIAHRHLLRAPPCRATRLRRRHAGYRCLVAAVVRRVRHRLLHAAHCSYQADSCACPQQRQQGSRPQPPAESVHA